MSSLKFWGGAERKGSEMFKTSAQHIHLEELLLRLLCDLMDTRAHRAKYSLLLKIPGLL